MKKEITVAETKKWLKTFSEILNKNELDVVAVCLECMLDDVYSAAANEINREEENEQYK